MIARTPLFRILGMACFMAVLASCDDLDNILDPDNGDPPNYLEALAGSWQATGFTFTSNANAAVSFDAIAAGAQMALVIAADGKFTATFVFPGEGMDIDTGTVAATATALTVTPVGESPMVFQYTLVGSVLTLVNANEEFDFNQDGTPESATLTVVLQPAGPGPDLEELAGLWTAESFRFTELESPYRSMDLVQSGGFMTIEIDAAGIINAVIGFPGQDADLETGSISIAGNIMTVTMPGQAPMPLTFSLAGGKLMTSLAPMPFDFGDGSTAARLEQVFVPIAAPPPLASFDGVRVLDEMQFLNPFNPAQTFTASPEQVGVSFTSVIDDGELHMFIIEMGDEPELVTGPFTVFGNVLLLDFGEGENVAVKYTLADDVLTFAGIGDSFDWNGDGYEEPAVLQLRFAPYVGPGLEALVGTWTAASWVLEDPTQPGMPFDLLAPGGVITMELQPDGQARMIKQLAERGPHDEYVNTMATYGPVLAVSQEEYTSFLLFSVNQEGVQVINPYDSFAFDGPEHDERPAVLTIQFVAVTDIASAEDLAGTWELTEQIFTEIGGAGRTLDGLDPDVTGYFTVGSDLSFTMEFVEAGEDPEQVAAGYIEIFGNILIVYFPPGMGNPPDTPPDGWAQHYELTGTQLKLWIYNAAADFDGTGTVPAIIESTYVKDTT